MNLMNHSRELVLYIDRLRLDRNISQDIFLENIVSSRQYRRYLSGDSTLSYVVLDKLSKRLGYNAEFVIMEVEAERIKHSFEIHTLYNAIASKNKVSADMILNEIKKHPIYLESNEMLYHHCLNMYDYHFSNSSQKSLIDKTKKLVGLDKLLLKKVLSTTELLIMVTFFNLDQFEHIDLIANKLESYLKNDFIIVSGQNVKVIILVYEELSRYYSIRENYIKMYEYAIMGINYANEVESIYMLEALYFFAGAASFELNELERCKKYLIQCYTVLLSEDNLVKMASYKSFFKDAFDIDIAEEIRNLI
ncbi:Putative transcriptional regulator [Paracholeplasma brassicae]|uniref:Putative transcriptional regulator n=1 Tax=Acholeplasma brassicae TaxID=61635 RepID=U4KQU9_9MOLU|nr:hypothetical protein [Paracholeplasma brassicae]CCV65173.1 Putative transcriptional regulator [Paracholeplasma brassicae]